VLGYNLSGELQSNPSTSRSHVLCDAHDHGVVAVLMLIEDPYLNYCDDDHLVT
jgi:hypothetical protein